MTWQQLDIDANDIIYSSEKAVLIRLPSSSRYTNYTYWHPMKLIQPWTYSFQRQVIFNEQFEFTLTHQNKQRQVIDTFKATPERLLEIYQLADVRSS